MAENPKRRENKTQLETVEVRCPKCGRTEIVFIPKEEVPKCPVCNKRMVIKEVLTEGKSY